jgi:hypothetical protein
MMYWYTRPEKGIGGMDKFCDLTIPFLLLLQTRELYYITPFVYLVHTLRRHICLKSVGTPRTSLFRRQMLMLSPRTLIQQPVSRYPFTTCSIISASPLNSLVTTFSLVLQCREQQKLFFMRKSRLSPAAFQNLFLLTMIG